MGRKSPGRSESNRHRARAPGRSRPDCRGDCRARTGTGPRRTAPAGSGRSPSPRQDRTATLRRQAGRATGSRSLHPISRDAVVGLLVPPVAGRCRIGDRPFVGKPQEIAWVSPPSRVTAGQEDLPGYEPGTSIPRRLKTPVPWRFVRFREEGGRDASYFRHRPRRAAALGHLAPRAILGTSASVFGTGQVGRDCLVGTGGPRPAVKVAVAVTDEEDFGGRGVRTCRASPRRGCLHYNEGGSAASIEQVGTAPHNPTCDLGEYAVPCDKRDANSHPAPCAP